MARQDSLGQLDTLLTTGATRDHHVNRDMGASGVAGLSSDDRRALHEYLVYYWTP